MMELSTYQKLSARTLPDYKENLKDAVSNYSMGLAGESGECVDILKKSYHHSHPLQKDLLVKELGDIMHYVSGLATMHDISLEDVAVQNIEKLNKRYPNGFSVEDSIKRVDTHDN